MKIGGKIRILTIPADLPEGEIQTKSLFEMCVGRIFSVVGFQGSLLELHVGEVKGEPPFMESIWIEPDHVEIVATADKLTFTLRFLLPLIRAILTSCNCVAVALPS